MGLSAEGLGAGPLPRRAGQQGRELVGDCEAFLAGHLAESQEAGDRGVPVWAWTNLLAHGTEEELRIERALTHGWSRAWADEWRDARSYLAAELIDLTDDAGSLAEVQRSVLVPLELELASRGEVDGWEPHRWVGAVEAALTRYRQLSRRSQGGEANPPR